MNAHDTVVQVCGVLQCAKNQNHVQTWYRLNHAAIDAAGFNEFIKSICTNWLDLGWEQEVKLLILGSSQGMKPIADWIMLVESINALLLVHACVLSTNNLQHHIQSHLVVHGTGHS